MNDCSFNLLAVPATVKAKMRGAPGAAMAFTHRTPVNSDRLESFRYKQGSLQGLLERVDQEAYLKMAAKKRTGEWAGRLHDDHREIERLLNLLKNATSGDGGRANAASVFGELLDLIIKDVNDEERIMAITRWGEFSKHHDDHTKIIDIMSSFVVNIEQSGDVEWAKMWLFAVSRG